MAIVYLNWPAGINMTTSQTFYGTVISATSSQIVIQDDALTAVYNGTGFTYSDAQVTGGVLTGYQETDAGENVFTVSGLDVAATAVAYDVENDQIQSLFSLALSGNDTIYGSPGNDTIAAYNGPAYVDGGGGIDTEVFSGVRSQYSITSTPQGLVVMGDFQNDTLVGIQFLQFQDETIAAPCFASGSRIAGESGFVLVDDLRIGQLVRTFAGSMLPVKWIGHRHVDCRRHPNPRDVWPVRVSSGAFGESLPCRELWLSPDHAVFIDGVLIPIRYLLNGQTIRQERRDAVTYWHVELDRHDVILAEGLPCETYLDTGNRGAFANGDAPIELHPDFAMRVWTERACAPIVLDGTPIVAAKRALLTQAAALGHTLTETPDLRVLANGRALPVHCNGRRWHAALPSGTSTIRLTSRVWTPAYTRPTETDTRRLGVAISRLWLDRREMSLDSPALHAGWLTPETDWRWTDGDAALAVAGAGEIAFEVAMVGSYWQEAATPGAAAVSLAAR